MAWFLVIVAGVFEMGFAVLLKQSHGITLGAAGTPVIGMVVLGESVSTLKLVSISLILVGVIGLNLAGVTPP